MGEQQLAAVKEYIAKYNLEDELSTAVNMAIKQDSDDPFRVIADYLSMLANETEEEEEDDDDIIEEGMEIPAMQPRGRRNQVMAQQFEVPQDWAAPIYEKSDVAKTFLKETMATNRLMKSLAPSDREQLMHAFQEKTFDAGAEIIKQGAPGDDFYIVDSGSCDISIEGKGSVMKAGKGISFGELALLHNAPRAATVTAEERVVCWALDMISFKMILMGKSQTDATAYQGFVKEVPILKGLGASEVAELASCLKEREYPEGANIICEGDEGDNFYIIREGEVKCTKAGSGEVSRPLIRGDFFGELALLSADKRAATVTASKPTSVLFVTRAEFTRLLGPMADHMSAEALAARTK